MVIPSDPADRPPATGRDDALLRRALAWATADLDEQQAARTRAEALRSPAWAARYAYALGYWEGGEDVQTGIADELLAVRRALAEGQAQLARPWWRLLTRLDWRRRAGRTA